MSPSNDFIQEVIEIFNRGNSTEHSYRPTLQKFLDSFNQKQNVTNEPKRNKVGAPDFVINQGDTPIGYLEAKDIGVDLDKEIKTKDQIKRYLSLGNLCFTNNLDWIFFYEGEEISRISIGYLDEQAQIVIDESKLNQLENRLSNFLEKKSITIKSGKELAKKMAGKAKLIKDVIYESLESENPDTLISNQYSSFKEILIKDLDHDEFSDIYAQTLAYGFFTARFYDPTLPTFSRDEARNLLPKSNPFLRNFFDQIAGINANSSILWVIEELVQLFIRVDVAAILQNFGYSTRTNDPIIHFYETFLSEYDPKKRKAKGVYYTPQPVVDFIIRSVDEILENDFGLSGGLANNEKVRVDIPQSEMNRKGVQFETLANNHKRYYVNEHKVQILDPATGTGTFLLSTLKHVHNKFHNQEGIWKSYAKNDLIPRLFGFELMMSSYSVAHLKLAMELKEQGVELDDNQRLEIYLTNSLEEGHEDTHNLFAGYLSHESVEANHIKNNSPVMVVMGNPPYSVSSSNSGQWIQSLIKDYKKDLNERKINLDDDYIKFIRYGQHYIDKNGEGVLAYISNNSFIDGVTHRQMRKELLKSFDEIYILDLHGNSKKKETTPDGEVDQNVFDIMQGVSINIFVKKKSTGTSAEAVVYHSDLFGKRDYKYKVLDDNSIGTIKWAKLKPDPKYKFFVPKDFALQEEYEKGVKLSELFKVYNSGVETAKDTFIIKNSETEVNQLFDDLLNLSIDEISNKSGFNKKEKIKQSKDDVLNSGVTIKAINYRPFDIRYTLYSANSQGVLWRPRHEISRHFLNNNIGLSICKRQTSSDFRHVLISANISERCYVSLQTGELNYNIPLYLYA